MPIYNFPISGLLATVCTLLLAGTLDPPLFAQQPANSKVALQDSFDRKELGNDWQVLKGKWKVADGALIGIEQTEDKHAAVISHKAETGNAVYEFKFMFSETTESLEFGFNRPNEETVKNQSQFSLRITPSEWSLVKDKNAILAQDAEQPIIAKQQKTFAVDRWHGARITTWGPYVTAKIDNRITLTGSAQTFAQNKSAIVFRSSGAPVEIDDIQIWTQR